MKGNDLIKLIGSMALTAAKSGGMGPGPMAVSAGVDALLHRNDNPNDDLEETVAALAQIAAGGVETGEQLTGKDIVNDEVLMEVAVTISRNVNLFRRLLVERHGAKVQPQA